MGEIRDAKGRRRRRRRFRSVARKL